MEKIPSDFLALSQAQKRAVEAHKVLYSSFIEPNNHKEIFPDNYGGDYIEDNILHICIVDLSSQDLTPYKTLLSDYLDDIVFEDVVYSLSGLLSAADKIADQLIDDGIPVVSHSANSRYNAVTVGVEKTHICELNLVSVQAGGGKYFTLQNRTYDVPVLLYPEDYIEPCASILLMGGTRLEGYTLGMCGTYNSKPAFAMCGHGLTGIGEEIYLQDDSGNPTYLVGTVAVKRYDDNKEGDYAIVAIKEPASDKDPSFTTTNMVGDPADPEYERCHITSQILRASIGTFVTKYGKNGGSAYGYVINDYYTWHPKNGTTVLNIKDLVEASITKGICEHGDSGGPVYTPDREFCGTHSGSGSDVMVFSPSIFLKTAGFQPLFN